MKLHWGWPRHNLRPRPFLQNALEQVEGEIPGMFTQVLEREVLSKIR